MTTGIVNVPVASLRAAPQHRSELVSQALLGEAVTLLEQQGEWWQVATPHDQYQGWLNESALVTNPEQVNRWLADNLMLQAQEPALISQYITLSAQQVVAPVLRGSWLAVHAQMYEDRCNVIAVRLPDGRQGYVRYEQLLPAQPAAEESRSERVKKIIQKGRSMIGTPYLWGGTTLYGIDCSGFIQKLFRYEAHIQLPRDAWQQALATVPYNSPHWQDWAIGSLLFFGTPEQVSHVALYVGQQCYLHADGYVRLNSLNPEHPHYNAYRKNTFLYAANVSELDRSSQHNTQK